MEFGKRHKTQRTFARTNLLWTLCCGFVVDLLRETRQLVTDLLRGNWCNGFWPLTAMSVQVR